MYILHVDLSFPARLYSYILFGPVTHMYLHLSTCILAGATQKLLSNIHDCDTYRMDPLTVVTFLTSVHVWDAMNLKLCYLQEAVASSVHVSQLSQ